MGSHSVAWNPPEYEGDSGDHWTLNTCLGLLKALSFCSEVTSDENMSGSIRKSRWKTEALEPTDPSRGRHLGLELRKPEISLEPSHEKKNKTEV